MPQPIVGSAEDLEAGRVEPPDRKVAEDATVGRDAQPVAAAPRRQLLHPSRRQRRDPLLPPRARRKDRETKESPPPSALQGPGRRRRRGPRPPPKGKTPLSQGRARCGPESHAHEDARKAARGRPTRGGGEGGPGVNTADTAAA